MDSENRKTEITSEPPKTEGVPVVSPEAMLEKIVGLENQIERTRHKQTLVSVLGIIGILAVLIVFVLNLCTLAQSINQEAVVNHLVRQSPILTGAPELQEIQKDFRNVFLPAFRDSVISNLKAKEGDFEKAFCLEWEQTLKYLQKDISKQLFSRLNTSFEKINAKLLKKYEKEVPSLDILKTSLDGLEKNLVEQTSDTLSKELKEAEKSLASLQGNILSFQDLPEYKNLKGMSTAEAENHLIETFLEIWIYDLNPARNILYKSNEKGGI